MKSILSFLFILLCITQTTAQDKYARLNVDYLRGIVMPDYEQKMEDLQRYMDSLKTATMNSEAVKQWERDIKQADAVWKPGPGAKEAKKKAEDKAQLAMEGINRQKLFLDDSYMWEYGKRFKPYLDMLDSIKAYKNNNSYDMVFEYGATGVTNILYRDKDFESQMRIRLRNCIKLPDGLSEAEKQAEYNKLSIECQKKIFGPMLDASSDITEKVVQLLKK